MLSQSLEKKITIRYIIILCMFLLAGVCQKFDDGPILLLNTILSVLSNCLFFTILISWYLSLNERIVENKTRRYLSIVAILLLGLMSIRFIKYNLPSGQTARFLWYMYYIPECLAPVFMLLVSLQIGRKKNVVNKLWHILFVPSLVFIVFFLTNDFHQFCFSFKPKFENYDSEYKHKIIFYLALSYNALLSLSSVGILFYKCTVSTVRRKIWIPVGLFIATSLLLLCSFIFNFDSFKVPELLCLITISLIESMIYIGFIPSNYNYKRYFLLSNTQAVITDYKLNIYAYSNKADALINQDLPSIKAHHGMTNGNYRFSTKSIEGGHVFWIEDMTTINYLNNEIQEMMKQINGENDLLQARNNLKEERARIEEQRKLYEEIEDKTCEQTNMIHALLEEPYKENVNLKLACIYLTYIKRRSNLIILHEKDNNVHIDELNFAIRESMTYLSLYGVSCSLIGIKKDISYPIEIVELIYDFFEKTVEISLPSLNALMVKFSQKKNILQVRICLSNPRGIIDSKWKEDELKEYKGHIEVITSSEDDETYIILEMEVE